MQYGGDYWNIKKILPYQRNFNFINSIRDAGKTYTGVGFAIERFLHKGEESLFLVRTVKEKDKGALKKWVDKVVFKEFPQIKFQFTNETMYYAESDKKFDWKPVIHCRALSEAVAVKKQSFPRVKWLFMDEYMLEPKHSYMYVNGWEEPNLLLNIYHTVDREEDRVVCFLFGNNTAFYNPYHLHSAFQIPPTGEGEIWKSENVLFQFYKPPDSLKEKKKKNKFLKMVEGTEYGKYAVEGVYIGDNENFIEQKTNKANFVFAFSYDNDIFGVWYDYNYDRTYISVKFNLGNQVCLALDKINKPGNIVVNKKHSLIRWLAKKYVNGRVFYESMEIKLKCENIIQGRML